MSVGVGARPLTALTAAQTIGVDLKNLRSEFLRTIGTYLYVDFACEAETMLGGLQIYRHILLLNKSGYYSIPKVEYALDRALKELSKTPLTFGIAPWDRFFLEAFLN